MRDVYRYIAQCTVDGIIGQQFATKMISLIKQSVVEKDKDIAIIGISSKFPYAEDIDEFWENLINGRDCVTDFPQKRESNLFDFKDASAFKVGGYLSEIDKFDYSFFNISPKEASLMDPNQRLFLQTVWQTIEDAGYGGGQLQGSKTGLYVGYSNDFGIDYKQILLSFEPESSGIATPGNIKSIIASRISYILDLKGPSMVVDTACSSSLTAIHLACQGIKNNECEMAIAGGVKVMLRPPEKSNSGTGIGIESSDGKAKTFDYSSDGTGLGEGVAAILLKPLDKAVKDMDNIYAIIRGSAINQDGSSIGITAPNALAQRDVILKAWKESKIDPETISYIEAHGTGTKLGDPIEIEGIERAFRAHTQKRQFCAVGSVKTNIGHLDNAAGMAGIIKAILALKHRTIPPTLHFSRPNINIDFVQSPVYVNDKQRKWCTDGFPRRCGVSAFGLSGTNGHIVLEEAPVLQKRISEVEDVAEDINILTISAKSKFSLRELINKYRDFVKNNSDINIRNICYTANTGRGHYSHRIALIVNGIKDLIDKLDGLNDSLLEGIINSNIYYKEHKIATNNKKEISPGVITEEEIGEKSQQLKVLLKQIKCENIANFKELLDQICRLYVDGADVKWQELYETTNIQRVRIPTYAFEKKVCWIENLGNRKYSEMPQNPDIEIHHPLFNGCFSESYDRLTYYSEFSVESHWVLNEYKVAGVNVVSGTTFIEMALESSKKLLKDSNVEMRDVEFIKPLTCSEGERKEVQTIINKGDDFNHFVILSKNNISGLWEKHAEGNLKEYEVPDCPQVDISVLKELCIEKDFLNYSNSPRICVETGPRWGCYEKIYYGNNEIIALICLPINYFDDMDRLGIHPSLMDVAVNMAIRSIGEGLYLPLAYKNIKVYKKMPARFYSCIKRKDNNTNTEVATFDVDLVDESGNIFIEIEDYSVKKICETELKYNQTNDNIYYEIGWIQEELISKENLQEGVTLVFKGVSNTARSLFIDLCKTYDTIEVEVGSEYEEVTQNHYIIGQKEEDYKKLFASIKDKGITRIIHMMSLTEYEDIDTIDQLEYMEMCGLYSLFYITKATLENKIKGNIIELIVISDYANYVTKNELAIKPLNSALFGIVKVIEHEYNNIKCRCIDVDNLTNIHTIISEIKNKLLSKRVAYRDNVRYVEELREVDINSCKEKEIKVKDGGVYVITGGTGGIGLEVAKYIAAKSRVKLVLINRTNFPSRKIWDDILLLNEDEKLCKKIDVIREIECSGSEVILYSVDVAVEGEMRHVINDIRGKYGKINGIIHSAGVAGDGFIVKKDKKVFDNVVDPKIKGTWILDKITKNDRLDFFIMFSSITSILGGPGQGDYTAANAFLDLYSTYMNKRGGKALTINWPAWKETGMAVDYRVDNNDDFLNPIPSSIAISSFNQIVNKDVSNIIICNLNMEKLKNNRHLSPIKLSRRIRERIDNVNSRKCAEKNTIKGHVNVKLKGKSPGDHYSETERFLGEIWGELLGLDEIDIYDEFLQLGGNSIIAVKMEAALENSRLKVDMADIGKYTTIKELAGYIDKNEKLTINHIDSNDIINDKNSTESNYSPLIIKPQELCDFEPFNDIFYKQCFYNSLFSVIIGFGREIFAFLANDIIVYSKYNEEAWIGSNIIYIPCKSLKQLLYDLGITVYTKTHEINLSQVREVQKFNQKLVEQLSKDIGLGVDKKEPLNHLIESIIESIANNHAVIIWVDCFYESIRLDTYNKIHWPHTLLLCKYDEERRVFKTIEHDHIENLTYKECEIGVDDVFNCYKGFIENYQVSSDMPTYFDFEVSKADGFKNRNIIDKKSIISSYKINILGKMGDILDGLDFLKEFTHNIKKILCDEEVLKSEANLLISNLNIIISSKQVERYKIARLFKDDFNLRELICKIIDLWISLRNVLIKYTYTYVYYKHKFCLIAEQMDDICNLENEYFKKVFEYLQTI